MSDLSDVSNALLDRRKKMKDSAVVPNVISTWGELRFDNIGGDPVNALGGRFQAFLAHVNCRL